MLATRSKPLVLSSLLLLCLGLSPATPAAEPATGGSSQLRGKISGPDLKPLAGVTVLAYHLSSEAVFSSGATNSNGEYEIAGLPYGYFDLGVQTADGLYVADQVVNIPPNGKTVVSLTLKNLDEADDDGEGAARIFPGSDADPAGVANVSEKLAGREFWRSRKGIAIITGSGAAALLLIAGGGSSSSTTPVTSASNP